MGLTGFNRQRKRDLSAKLGVDERTADKLMAYGYSTLEAVKKADAKALSFLSEKELKQLNSSDEKEPEDDGTTVESEPEEETEEFPKGGKGGWWTLSNGKKIQGSEEDAKQAQSKLDSQE